MGQPVPANRRLGVITRCGSDNSLPAFARPTGGALAFPFGSGSTIQIPACDVGFAPNRIEQRTSIYVGEVPLASIPGAVVPIENL